MIKRWIVLFILFSISGIMAAPYGRIVGTVKDAGTGEPLPGANVMLKGTNIGAASDLEGRYRISRVPPGTFTLVVTYIGYKPYSEEVKVAPGRTLKKDIALVFDVIKGKEVVVTAQLEGQARAINQQLSSNTIVNIVSSDKIQELPDQNAAESLGRLPGISVQRDAGEGQKVIVRGLQPKFNSIMVNNERVPSTDPEDRSVDLSMISPDVLAGIEVYKSLRPDMDADAIGGVVNFVVRKAAKGKSASLRIQGGYNDHENDYSPYKASVSMSNRFLSDRLGVLVTGSMQRANRGSDVLDASYYFKREEREGEQRALIEVNKLNLGDRQEIRKRYSASLAMDYQLPNGSIFFSSFWGRTDRKEIRRRHRYNLEAFRVEYDLRDRNLETQLLTNSLRGKHHLLPHSLNMELDWRTSFSRTLQTTPFIHYARFYELGGFTNDLIDDQGPELIPLGAKNDLDKTFFKYSSIDGDRVDDRNLTGQLDLKIPFSFWKNINGYVKMGVKIREKGRQRDKDRLWTSHFGINQLGAVDTLRHWDLTSDKKIRISNFLDPDFHAANFLNGQYKFGPGLDVDRLNDFYYTYRNYLFNNDPKTPLYVHDPVTDLEDYKAGEQIRAGYLMTEINIGKRLMFLPGFRYEHTTNDYKSIYGTPRTIGEGEQSVAGVIDTTGYRQYGEFLPMVHLRYKPVSWFDIRLATTRTLSRPNYFNLVPWQRVEHLDQVIERGDPDLKPTRVWNYDAFFSFYNRLGLFTVGLYYKSLYDVDYIRTSRIQGGKYNGYTMIAPENAKSESIVKGFEIELQTNLRMLPSPLDGIVIYANYSHISSRTYYPYLKVERGGPPFFQAIFIDTVRVGRMPGQAENIANLTIGYEKKGFSGRISMVYQGESLMTVGTRSELDGYTDAFVRWDLVMQQKIFDGFSVYFNMNNITNRPESAFLGIKNYPTREEYFGWTADLGIRYKF